MGQPLALSHRQRLGGRLQRARHRFIINRLPARSRGRRDERQVPDGDALEVPQLAVLSQLASANSSGLAISTHIGQQPGPLSWWGNFGRAGCVRLLSHVT
jgi:hypothetical protein